MNDTTNSPEARPTKWVCDSCGKTLHPSDLTRVGIGVHHYDYNKDISRDGLLNCGLVKEVVIND
jgi:hypothetical protein